MASPDLPSRRIAAHKPTRSRPTSRLSRAAGAREGKPVARGRCLGPAWAIFAKGYGVGLLSATLCKPVSVAAVTAAAPRPSFGVQLATYQPTREPGRLNSASLQRHPFHHHPVPLPNPSYTPSIPYCQSYFQERQEIGVSPIFSEKTELTPFSPSFSARKLNAG